MHYPFLLICMICMIACSDSLPPTEQIEDDLNASIQALQASYGDPSKTDAQAFIDPCTLIHTILEWGDEIVKSGFFVGVGGEGVLGFGLGFGGYDIV